LSQVRVKRKGQVTIPVELRRKFNLEEGSLLEAEEHREGILLRSLPPVRAGKAVGERTYKEIIRKLNESRRKKWR
jgi:AbrB family looped-hinge helix DNA binding protein